MPADFKRSYSRVRDKTLQIAYAIGKLEQGATPSLSLSEATEDESGESDDSDGSDNTEDGLQALWFQLKDRRQRLNEMRQRMAIKRRELREHRRTKDEADNAFMSLVRPILIKNRRSVMSTSEDQLEKRLQEMQKARTEYGWLESEYEGLEGTMDEEEIELDKLETRFFSLLAVGRAQSARVMPKEEVAETEQQEEAVDVPIMLRGISRDGPTDDDHPLWLALMSALGDLQLAREEHDDLLLQREQILHDVDMKKKAGLVPNDTEWEFLNDFPNEEREKVARLKRLTDEVEQLKKVCAEKGAMKKNPNLRLAYLLNPAIDTEDMPLDLAPASSLANPRFPVILSQPEHILAADGPFTEDEALRRAIRLPDDDPAKSLRLQLAMKEFHIHGLVRETEENNKADFMNRWLLQQLRTSPMAAELLYTTFTRRLKIMDPYRWQEDVLVHWWRDGTVNASGDLSGMPLDGEDDLMVELHNSVYRGHEESNYGSEPATVAGPPSHASDEVAADGETQEDDA